VSDPAGRTLARWLTSPASCAATVVKLKPRDCLGKIPTPHQFIITRNAPADRDRRFHEHKRKAGGTKFAFHGSRTDCWFAILNNGIKNCSGTSLQTTGAAKGAGVYLATAAATALGYCRAAKGWCLRAHAASSATTTPAAATGGSLIDNKGAMIVLALCEVVKDGINDHQWCWTVPDETKVAVRMLFAFESPAAANVDIAQDAAFSKAVEKLIDDYAL